MLYPPPLTVLARALLHGAQDLDSLVSRVQDAVGKRGLPAIVKRYREAFVHKPHAREREVIDFLRRDVGFRRLRWNAEGKKFLTGNSTIPAQMRPSSTASSWLIPPITTVSELCTWLRLPLAELGPFADLKGMNGQARHPSLQHYRNHLVAKRSGGLRLIEAPKQRLKLLQREILADILNAIPTHPAAHGFVRGRSIQSFAAPHIGQRAVLRMDIENFFPSISFARVAAFFRTAGYPERVADFLAGLCTHAVPNKFWRQLAPQPDTEARTELKRIYSPRHLPQGAPASPALANLCAYRLDCRLHALAQAGGAVYSRYADDLAFSGGAAFDRAGEAFAGRVAAILLEEGFHAAYRKTRLMRQSVRQQLTGLVVNRHLNLPREDYDHLKAILTNCVRSGPQNQNRDALPDFRAHLLGRVAFVESIHPARGAKLRSLFNRIVW